MLCRLGGPARADIFVLLGVKSVDKVLEVGSACAWGNGWWLADEDQSGAAETQKCAWEIRESNMRPNAQRNKKSNAVDEARARTCVRKFPLRGRPRTSEAVIRRRCKTLQNSSQRALAERTLLAAQSYFFEQKLDEIVESFRHLPPPAAVSFSQ